MVETKKRLYLSTPTMHGTEMDFIEEAVQTNWMSTVGENIDTIEAELCQLVGCSHAVALTTGTAALHMAVKLAGVKPGDRVFCSDMTFAASVNPVVYEKGCPVFIDAEPDSWNMDPVALEKAFRLYPDTKVVIVANLYGTPAKYDEICAIAAKYGAVVIEDAAESLGSTYRGRQTGTFGKYNALSFNGNKIITGSSGGMLLTDDAQAAAHVRKWSTQSRENTAWYQHQELGYNYRMSNVIAGVVRGQIPYLPEHKARKEAIYRRYQQAFRDLPVDMNPYDGDMQPNFWLSCITIRREAMCHQERGDLQASYLPQPGKSCPTQILEALEKANKEARPIWMPMHMQPLYAAAPFVTRMEGSNVGADIFERGLCLPSDIKMTPQQQDGVIAIVRSCFA